MLASPAKAEVDPSRNVAELAESLAAFAAGGDWEGVEACVQKLRAAVMDVPVEERREAVLAARRSIEAVQPLAEEAREEVAGRLSTLRRGKQMTAAYGATD